jgi:tetratricopeptide (TPR) repeat protein
MRRAVLLLLAVSLISCRETPHRAQPQPQPQQRVLFVGLDGADWQLLDRFIADGTMPNLAQLVTEGSRGVLHTQQPPLSPLVWTTMMTGVSPLEHRILDFTRFNPVTHEKEPITSDERAVPAIWNMASSAGRRVAVFGLWATYPAEEVNGVLVSDRLFSYQYDTAAPIRSVWPAADEARARATLAAVDKTTGFDTLRVYLPSLANTGYERLVAEPDPFAHPETALRRIVIETDVMHRLALETIERDKPDLAIVYIQGTDAIGHLFAPYFPPQLPGISDGEFARYHDVPRMYFHHVDALLGEYRDLARRTGAVLVIASDHGFRWFEGRSSISSTAAVTAAKWHRDEGIILEVPRQTKRLPDSVSGICTMLLDRLGMSQDLRSYRRDYHRTATATSGDREDLAKLKALGYLGGNESSANKQSSTRTAGSWNNEGLLLRAAKRDSEAEQAFESALRVDPKNAAAMWNLSELLRLGHGDAARATALLDSALQLDPHEPRWFLTRGRVRLEQHDCRGALQDFQQTTALAPGDALAFASSGTASLCLGDERAARAAFGRSLELDPNQPQLRRLLEAPAR